MSELHTPAVAALIEACIKGLAMSEFAYRDDWPDIGKTSRELLHKRTMAVLEATGISLETLAQMAQGASVPQSGPVPKLARKVPNVRMQHWGWWRR